MQHAKYQVNKGATCRGYPPSDCGMKPQTKRVPNQNPKYTTISLHNASQCPSNTRCTATTRTQHPKEQSLSNTSSHPHKVPARIHEIRDVVHSQSTLHPINTYLASNTTHKPHANNVNKNTNIPKFRRKRRRRFIYTFHHNSQAATLQTQLPIAAQMTLRGSGLGAKSGISRSSNMPCSKPTSCRCGRGLHTLRALRSKPKPKHNKPTFTNTLQPPHRTQR